MADPLRPRDPPLSPAQTTTTMTNDQSTRDIERWRKIIYNTCFGLCFACPVIALLPPRKFDLYTFGLGVTWVTCAGYVSEQKTGQGILWHLGNAMPSARNREKLEQLRKEEAAAKQRREELFAVNAKKEDQPRGLLKSVWMGGESDDWIEERKRKEMEALEEGKGYGTLIWDQVKEVWGVDKRGDDEEDPDLKAVLDEKKEK